MMTARIRIPNAATNDPEAKAAVDAVNVAVGQIAVEAQQIEAEGADILKDAEGCDPTDAPKLAKRVESLRVRRLANVIRELRVPAMKAAVEPVVRSAARAEVDRWAKMLVEHDAILNQAADSIGMGKDSPQRRNLFLTDENRRSLLAAVASAEMESNNWFARTEADAARVAELKAELASMLR